MDGEVGGVWLLCYYYRKLQFAVDTGLFFGLLSIVGCS